MIRCLVALLVVICSAHAAVAQNGGYVVPNVLDLPDDAYHRGMNAILKGNYAEAIKWYRVAADQGDPRAQTALGDMNDGGVGMPQNYAEAIKWYRVAADQGDPRAQTALGDMNDGGVGMPQNYAEAIKWWRRSADQGYALAQWKLGLAYAYGEEVAQDFVQPHMWLNLAASAPASAYPSWAETNIRAGASEQRNLVARKMTLAQVTEAQKLATEWKPKLER